MIENLTQKQFKEDDGSVYPVLLYIYGADGFHRGSIPINSKAQLEIAFKTIIKFAINEKREVRITDIGDLMVFHSYNGCIKYNGMSHHECENCKEKK